MSARFDLLRHGETELGSVFRGSLDDALTERGWEQMRAAVVGAGPWDAVVSSPLSRCSAFACELSAERGVSLSLEPDLRELHFGAWEGRSSASLMDDQADGLRRFWTDPYAFTPPGGEPMDAFAARVFAAMERLDARFAGGRVLVVTHGGVINLLLARARGLPRELLMSVAVSHGELHPLQLAAPGGRVVPR
ncbi:alpha-ribazole phosphatase family protein [Zestomonas carbonaria]|uniref:Adenosylcobalamin/alpha-ribazole phosphatase n=1 Tax=Zestomonas carbonaria TaxID=2762745 RepID=A0A7U7I901_9GAMM|nr:alpha-ribazole phosphatase family protein [Pseudomonas carbonaria]CAD5107711.1 Adenosylcobalamin/alpha-ribazole phosphatase [Pseudomonas carbonaria]